MNKIRNTFLAGIALLGLGLGSVQAAPIVGFPEGGTPDIFSAQGLIDYDADTGVLYLDGLTQSYTGSGSLAPELYWFINPTINNDGSLKSGLGFQIGGLGLLTSGFGAGFDTGTKTYLSGTLSAFGFGDANNSLQFLFNVTGGTLASEFGSRGAMIWGNTGFTLDSSIDGLNFVSQNDYPVVSDTFGVPVPEPSSLALLGIGLIGFGIGRKRLAKRG